jgi:4-amino-4-deoxy-L-arabinose transferase-like glycosyltransferase
MPWTFFTVPALIEAGRNAFTQWRSHSEPTSSDADAHAQADDGLTSFLFVWIVVPIVFFSISRAKLPGYILPAIPAAALLAADYLHRLKAIPRLLTSLHALLCAMLMVGALMAPFAMAKQAPPPALQIGMTITGAIIAVMVLLMVRREGVRVLHFVTLVPTILAVAFLLRPAAATIDRTQSARPINQRLAELGVSASDPVASFNVKRQVAYGLDFYRNQPISHYEQEGPLDMPSGVPSAKHVVVAREGSLGAVQAVAGDRQVTSIGTFPPQHLEFFLVSAAK